MTNGTRKMKPGDVVTLKVHIVEVYEDKGLFTAVIDGNLTAIHVDWDGIVSAKPFDPNAIYR